MQYAIKIRKSDLPLIAMLNHGVEPEIEKSPTYLIVNLDGHNEIVTETELVKTYEFNAYGPNVLKIKK